MNTDYNRFSRMTMDVHQHRNVTTAASSSPPSRYSPPVAAGIAQPVQTSLPATVVALHQRPQKRSFDVAFLMAPDDLSKRRPRPMQAAQPVARSAFTKVSPDPPLSLSPVSSPATPPPSDFAAYMHHSQLHHQQHHGQPQPQIHPHPLQSQQECSLSPPLPPVAAHFMSPFPLGFRSPFALMMPPRPQPTAVGCKDYPSPLQPSPQSHHHHQQQPQQQQQQQQQHHHQLQSLSTPSPLQFGQAAAAAAAVAALPAMLLPASIAAAALTLPSQNVCAKCNVSFRMTSDLVYHMRSHHKGGDGNGGVGTGSGVGSGVGGGVGVGGTGVGVDAKKRRDMDKLRCPVCDESFRERHHLTRHMTAHQDKEGDRLDDEDDVPLQQQHHQLHQHQGAK
ncbi:PREDICTED: box A-binding factor [Diuraphis noxia]|uniref:box A-binding factor n=1 Tax=Diuraphis noxia TaxID=143948 RepID=UPI0007639D22|nr:PREDICTED: box A-binding factor [Diuraphis noxia]